MNFMNMHYFEHRCPTSQDFLRHVYGTDTFKNNDNYYTFIKAERVR